jgi:predicted nucleotidyltransferase
MRFGLSDSTVSRITEIFSSFPGIEKVILYGSRAKGNFQNGSDIDLTIVCPKMDLSEVSRIETLLDDLLLPYKIDISLYHTIANQDLLEHIDRVGIVFYERS